MPEMTPLPNLSQAPLPAPGVRAANGAAAPASSPGAADAAKTSLSDAPPAASTADDAGTAPESFAMVLQRQMAQSAQADQPQPNSALPLDLALLLQPSALPPSALPPSALPPSALPPSALPPSALPPIVDLQSDLAPLPTPESALFPNLALLPPKTAAQTDNTIALKDLASQETPDASPPPLYPYSSALTLQIPANPDAGLPATDKKSGNKPAGDHLLNASAPALVFLLQTSSPKDVAQGSLAEVKPETANKTAEFAAILTSSAEALQGQASRNESSTGAGANFENLLAAAQMVSQNRSGEGRQVSQAPPALPMQTPVGAHGWDGEVGDRLVWMVGRQEQRAELVLNPPQLGRVEVSLSMNGDQASAIFVSHNPAVRDALEAALPRLREILADAGINLGQAHVGADTDNSAANQSTNNGKNSDNPALGSSMSDLAQGGETLLSGDAPPWLRRVNGMVDVFA